MLGDFGSRQFTLQIVDREPNAVWNGHLPWNNPGFEWKMGSQESETNLLYVSVTRAKRQLFIFIPTKSNLQGLHIGALVRTMAAISEVGKLQQQFGDDLPETEVFKHARLLAAATIHVPDTEPAPDYFVKLMQHAECIRHHMILGGETRRIKVTLPFVNTKGVR